MSDALLSEQPTVTMPRLPEVAQHWLEVHWKADSQKVW